MGKRGGGGRKHASPPFLFLANDLKITQYDILKGKKGMVVNTNIILDEGQNKYVAEYKMKTPIWVRFQKSWNPTICRWIIDDNLESQFIEEPNPDYIEPNRKLRIFLDKFYDDNYNLKYDYRQTYTGWEDGLITKYFTTLEMAEHLNIIPFNPCVMINISPDWKDKIPIEGKKGKKYIRLLNNTIHDYLNACNRYSKYQYCIECGGEGNFLHAHIIAEINPDLAKSVKTHINKGNHKYELMKMWDKNLTNEKSIDYEKFKSGKEKGSEGLLKGKFAVQRILINNETMRDDKLAYLKEENKPDGHKNQYDLNYIKGDF